MYDPSRGPLVLQVDIEGSEWQVLEEILNSNATAPFSEILVELHIMSIPEAWGSDVRHRLRCALQDTMCCGSGPGAADCRQVSTRSLANCRMDQLMLPRPEATCSCRSMRCKCNLSLSTPLRTAITLQQCPADVWPRQDNTRCSAK